MLVCEYRDHLISGLFRADEEISNGLVALSLDIAVHRTFANAIERFHNEN